MSRFIISGSEHIQDTRYKKLYFPSVIVQQITLATRAIFRHNRCKNQHVKAAVKREALVITYMSRLHTY